MFNDDQSEKALKRLREEACRLQVSAIVSAATVIAMLTAAGLITLFKGEYDVAIVMLAVTGLGLLGFGFWRNHRCDAANRQYAAIIAKRMAAKTKPVAPQPARIVRQYKLPVGQPPPRAILRQDKPDK